MGDHTAKPTWEGVRWSTGEENPSISQTSDGGCTVQFSSWSSNAGSLSSWGCSRVCGSLPNSLQCFVDLEKVFDCSPWGVLWTVLWNYWLFCRCQRAVSPCTAALNLVHVGNNKLDSFLVDDGFQQCCPSSPVLLLYHQDFLVQQSGRESQVWWSQNLNCVQQTTCFFWWWLDALCSCKSPGAECETAEMRI